MSRIWNSIMINHKAGSVHSSVPRISMGWERTPPTAAAPGSPTGPRANAFASIEDFEIVEYEDANPELDLNTTVQDHYEPDLSDTHEQQVTPDGKSIASAVATAQKTAEAPGYQMKSPEPFDNVGSSLSTEPAKQPIGDSAKADRFFAVFVIFLLLVLSNLAVKGFVRAWPVMIALFALRRPPFLLSRHSVWPVPLPTGPLTPLHPNLCLAALGVAIVAGPLGNSDRQWPTAAVLAPGLCSPAARRPLDAVQSCLAATSSRAGGSRSVAQQHGASCGGRSCCEARYGCYRHGYGRRLWASRRRRRDRPHQGWCAPTSP